MGLKEYPCVILLVQVQLRSSLPSRRSRPEDGNVFALVNADGHAIERLNLPIVHRYVRDVCFRENQSPIDMYSLRVLNSESRGISPSPVRTGSLNTGMYVPHHPADGLRLVGKDLKYGPWLTVKTS